MIVLGFVLALGLAAVSLGVAGITLWSGWRAVQDELVPSFKVAPPNPGSVVLTLVSVVLPLLMIGGFTVYLAYWLLNLGISAVTG